MTFCRMECVSFLSNSYQCLAKLEFTCVYYIDKDCIISTSATFPWDVYIHTFGKCFISQKTCRTFSYAFYQYIHSFWNLLWLHSVKLTSVSHLSLTCKNTSYSSSSSFCESLGFVWTGISTKSFSTGKTKHKQNRLGMGVQVVHVIQLLKHLQSCRNMHDNIRINGWIKLEFWSVSQMSCMDHFYGGLTFVVEVWKHQFPFISTWGWVNDARCLFWEFFFNLNFTWKCM